MIGNAAALLSTYINDRRSSGAMPEKIELIADADQTLDAILRSSHASRSTTGKSDAHARMSGVQGLPRLDWFRDGAVVASAGVARSGLNCHRTARRPSQHGVASLELERDRHRTLDPWIRLWSPAACHTSH